MVIASTDPLVFPDNAIALITARITTAVDADLGVFKRPLRPTDATQSVGVFPLNFAPFDDSIEIQSLQPTINRYAIVIQSFAKDFVEEDGIVVHSILSARLRSMFYRDPALHAGLTALQVTMNNSLERMQRRGITVQRFLSNEGQGGLFQYTAWLETWLETETVTQP